MGSGAPGFLGSALPAWELSLALPRRVSVFLCSVPPSVLQFVPLHLSLWFSQSLFAPHCLCLSLHLSSFAGFSLSLFCPCFGLSLSLSLYFQSASFCFRSFLCMSLSPAFPFSSHAVLSRGPSGFTEPQAQTGVRRSRNSPVR
uniref:Transmembrane protein n=1 Tax=Macaca mulatta TaxID=9544 RepID=A0A5F7ZXW5_MACMU